MKKITLLCFVVFTTFLHGQILSENFDDISNLSDWDFINSSEPMGSYQWQQGTGNLGSHSGTETSYIATNARSSSGTGTNSDWLILPTLSLKNGDKLSFYTKAASQKLYPDRLEVRLSTNCSNSAYPVGCSSVGDFNNVLLEINPNLLTETYPTTYTHYVVTISGLSTIPVDARIAFRYFVNEGGPEGPNGNGIAIDALEITSSTLNTEEHSLPVFKHYYNRANQTLNLNSGIEFKNLKIYNTMGQIVWDEKLNSNFKTLDISSFRDGLYIIKANFSNKQTKTLKFIK